MRKRIKRQYLTQLKQVLTSGKLQRNVLAERKSSIIRPMSPFLGTYLVKIRNVIFRNFIVIKSVLVRSAVVDWNAVIILGSGLPIQR